MNDVLPPPKRSMSDVGRAQRPSVSVPARQRQSQLQSKPQLKTSTQTQHQLPPVALPASEPELPLLEEPKPNQHLLGKPKKSRLKRFIWWSLGIFILIVIAAAASAYMWYTAALQPVSTSQVEKTRIHIVEGSSPTDIGRLLEEKKLIRSYTAFDIYTRLSGNRAQLQAGVYSLAASESTQEIVSHLISGNTDEVTITFIPGSTLAENREVLIKAGYDAGEVDAALGKTYDHPLMADKPVSSDLEGYIYGETYSFASGTTVEQILTRTFDEFYKVIEEGNLLVGFEKQGLNLYGAITVASIVQREDPGLTDQRQIAQVFLRRLAIDMPLGADPTYKYAAKKFNLPSTPALDSPYNTRIYAGLPPGPIATPGATALKAVADPAPGDFLYFLSGDDNVTYFAHTVEEHEANIVEHCQVKCSIL